MKPLPLRLFACLFILVVPTLADSLFEQVDVFTAGAEGYHTRRILVA